jgi:HSP20 family molecular chaperone IbpA
LEEMNAMFDKIGKRAFEFFERRGGAPGFDAEDWVRAEHDLFWVPQAELVETEAEFKIKVGVPGFEAKDLNITVQPTEILIQGDAEKREEKTEKGISYSEFGAESLYRRFALTTPIAFGAVAANVENGLLTVVAGKRKPGRRSQWPRSHGETAMLGKNRGRLRCPRMTGLPASGKSTIATALKAQLADRGVDAAVLESDVLRKAFAGDRQYDAEGRDAFYRQMLFVGSLLLEHGVPVIFDATAKSPCLPRTGAARNRSVP